MLAGFVALYFRFDGNCALPLLSRESHIYDLLNKEINFIFGLIAVIAAFDLLERLIKKLEKERKNLMEANQLLRLANTQIKESSEPYRSFV